MEQIAISQGMAARRLYQTLDGAIRAAVLKWALEQRIFDRCADGVLADDLACQAGYRRDPLRLVLNALVAADFLTLQDGLYQTCSDLSPFVTRAGGRDLTENLLGMARLRLAGLDDLEGLLRDQGSSSGRAGKDALFDAAYWDRTCAALQAFHRGVGCDAMMVCLRAVPGWDEVTSMLEIGSGSCCLAQAVQAERPDLRITLFDLPPVADRLRQQATEMGLSVTVIGGSYAETLPEGSFDLIWCSMTLYFDPAGVAALIDRLAGHLAPGGLLVSFHEALTDQRTAPAEHVLGRLGPALRFGDVSFDDGEIAAALHGSGLRCVSSRLVDTPFGHFRCDVGRREDGSCAG